MDKDNKNKLYEKVNDTYSIYIGPSEQSPDTPGVGVYKIINTETGVNEGEVSNLARAYAYASQFKQELVQIRAALKDGGGVVEVEEGLQTDWIEDTPTDLAN